MATLADKTSLLVFRVGPVLCCVPSLPVESIIMPPKLTHPPGSNQARPGIFKHGGHIVTGLDLRYKFGVDETDWITPGRMIVTSLSKGHVGFWVDEILQVIEQPQSGWGPLPPLLPRGIFSRTLLLENEIYLYAEFEALHTIPDSGYLHGYIQHLLEQQQQATTQLNSATAHLENTKPIANATISQQPATPVTASPASSPALKSSPRIKAVNTRTTPAPNSTLRKTSSVTKPRPATLTSPPARPQAIKTTVKTAPAVKRPTTAPIRQNTTTVNQQPSRRASQAPRNNTGGWLLLVLFLLLLASSGWLLLNTPDEQPEQIVQPAPTLQHDTSEVTSIAAADVEAATVIETPPNTDPVAESATTTPVPVMEKTIETDVATHEATPATVAPTYSASIEQDQEGFTIVIDAPDDSDIFKPDSSETNTVTDTAAETPQAEPELIPEETAPVKPLPKTEVIHIVVKGDTLWHIAIRYLNNPYLYLELAKLSNIKNPDLIYPGNRVRIIKRSKKSDS